MHTHQFWLLAVKFYTFIYIFKSKISLHPNHNTIYFSRKKIIQVIQRKYSASKNFRSDSFKQTIYGLYFKNLARIEFWIRLAANKNKY